MRTELNIDEKVFLGCQWFTMNQFIKISGLTKSEEKLGSLVKAETFPKFSIEWLILRACQPIWDYFMPSN